MIPEDELIYGSSFLNDTAQAAFSPSDQAAWRNTEHLFATYVCTGLLIEFVDLYTLCYAWPLHFLVMPGYILKSRGG
jgi:hypothetical protein